MKETSNNTYLKALSFLIVLLASLPSWATVTIYGKAEAYPEKELLVFKFLDHVSEEKELVKKTIIDARGNFEIQLECDSPELILLRIGRISCLHYIEQSAIYEVAFPDYPSDQPLSFHKRNLVALQFVKVDSLDINLLLDKYNASYSSFLSEHFLDIAKDQYKGSGRYKSATGAKLKSVNLVSNEDTLSRETSKSFYKLAEEFNNTQMEWLEDLPIKSDVRQFMHSTIYYSTAMLKMSAGLKRKLAYQQYLAEEPINISHPEYAAFVQEFYKNELSDITDDDESHELLMAINEDRNLTRFMSYIKERDIFVRDDLRSLATIIMLRESFHKSVYSKNSVLIMLDQMILTKLPFYETASWIRMNLASGMKGAQVPNFTLVNAKNERVSLSDFNGQWVYLSFTAGWCASCHQELQQMEILEEKYGNQITFVSVAMDDDYGEFRSFLKENRDFGWEFLYGGHDHLLKEKLGVYALPYFILVNPDGKRANAYTQKPSEGVGAVFARILAPKQRR